MADQVASFFDLRSGPLNKSFLSGPWGTRWQGVFGAAYDREVERLLWARRARWPDWAPTDGLTWIGSERGLEQVVLMGNGGRNREAEPDYRTRLRLAWYIWEESGSQRIHVDAFRWTGLTNVSVHRRKDWPFVDDAWAPTPYVRAFQRSVWAQFDILIDGPLPWQLVRWGDGHLWGGGWTWGSTATPAEVEQLKRLARRFASGHDTPMWLVVNASGGRVWGGGWKWGDGGLWGDGGGTVLRWLVGEEHWVTRGLV